MKHRTTSLIHNMLLLIGGVSLGLALRPSQPVAASSVDCRPVITRAALVEVRRVEGDGALDAQQTAWHGSMQLTRPDGDVTLTDETLPKESFSVVREDEP